MDLLWQILLIVGIAAVLVVVGLYFLNRWSGRRMAQQQDMIAKMKQSASIYVIDKKKDKAQNVNLPKVVTEQMPKYARLMKMYFVKAKIGPQIATLMCEKKVYNQIPLKKNIKVELAGMYIVSVGGASGHGKEKAEEPKGRMARFIAKYRK